MAMQGFDMGVEKGSRHLLSNSTNATRIGHSVGPQKLPLSLSLAHSCNINQARRRWREEEEGGRERAALLTIKGPRSTRSVGRPGGLYGRHRAPTQEKSQARQVDKPLHIDSWTHFVSSIHLCNSLALTMPYEKHAEQSH